jgi:hypothetical protein
MDACDSFFSLNGKEGEQLGPVHRSTRLVKIITRIQKLNTCQDLNGFSITVRWTQSFPKKKMDTQEGTKNLKLFAHFLTDHLNSFRRRKESIK